MIRSAAAPAVVKTRRPFRHDINALRTIAVGLVVLYHFKTPFVWGGFVGVDIFFVISGYLMTQIITGRLAEGQFNLWGFYADRFRRIVPALLVVCAVVLAIGAPLLDPIALKSVARSVASSITFLSNVDYTTQGGYFGAAPQSNWLLHTWSLSVEWQFYLLYPLLFMGLARLGAGSEQRWAVLASIGMASFLLCIAVPLLRYDAVLRASFFMLPTRAWELVAGGLVAMGPRFALGHAERVGLVATGLALILLSVLLFNDGTIWPNAVAAVPVLGAAFILSGNLADAPWTKIPGVQPIGRWSYSIYLWHWPVIAGLAYFGALESPIAAALGVLMSVGLGAASYYLVERRLTALVFEHGAARWRQAAAVVAVLCAAGVFFAADGLRSLKFPSSDPAVFAAAKQVEAASRDWTFPKDCAHYSTTSTGLRLCRQGGGGKVATLVVGDSYGEEIAPRYRSLARGAADPAVLFVTRPGCAPLPKVQLRGSIKDCAASTREALDMATSGRYPKVLIIGSWLGAFNEERGAPYRGRICFETHAYCRTSWDQGAYLRDATAAFARLRAEIVRMRDARIDVVVLKTFPADPSADPRRLTAALYRQRELPDFGVDTTSIRASAAYPNELVNTLGGPGGATLVDPIDFLCGRQCPMVEGGAPLFYDVSHIRARTVESPAFAFLDRYILPGAQPR